MKFKPNHSRVKKYFLYFFSFNIVVRFMHKFITLNIEKNKIIFLVFLKCRSSSHRFHKWVIKSKNTCKYINKTNFLWIFIFKEATSCLVFFFLFIFSIYDFFLKKKTWSICNLKQNCIFERKFFLLFFMEGKQFV
jgi:hypothetical protein